MSSIHPQVKILELSQEELTCKKLSSHTLQAAVEALHLDGLVVLKNAVDVAHLDKLNERMVAEAKVLYKQKTTARNFGASTGNIQQEPPVDKDYIFEDIIANAWATEVVECMFGPNPMLRFFSANTAFKAKGRQPVHIDVDFDMPKVPFGYCININLVDTSPKNGSTEIWLGTHSQTDIDVLDPEEYRVRPDLVEARLLQRMNEHMLDVFKEIHESAPLTPPAPNQPLPMPIPHHLLYFEPTKPPSDLLPDGTNPDHSPGEPFVRRMWAGGSVLFDSKKPLLMDNSRAVCLESIRDIAVKGKPGDEKVFVGIERRIAALNKDEEKAMADANGQLDKTLALEENIRQRLWMPSDVEFGPANIIERRNIVFMRERTPEQAKEAVTAAKKPGKMLKPQHEPDFHHTLRPDAQLLFRYSALTFNAHSIHLDPQYCQTVEGHKHLLVHGPLSFTLMLTILQKQLAKEGGREQIKSVEYKNLAPLYAYDPLKICGRKADDLKYEVWAETPEGGIAVKGTVKTEKV
ncbi:phytanoyl-CoA dioxygenase family protein, partial [Aureobasidium melanogenum]